MYLAESESQTSTESKHAVLVQIGTQINKSKWNMKNETKSLATLKKDFVCLILLAFGCKYQ